jgi:hypothetical protein
MAIWSQAGTRHNHLALLGSKRIKSYDFSLYSRHATRVTLLLHTAET